MNGLEELREVHRRLTEECARLKQLLDEPEAGLSTWAMCVQYTLRKIARLATEGTEETNDK